MLWTMSDEQDKQRIAELEAEVASLREQVGQPAEAPIQSAFAEHADAAVRPPSLAKVVGLGAALIILALGFFIAIYTAMSKGFDSLAHKAASTYGSEMTESDTPQQPAPSPAREPAPRVPGL